MPLFFRFRPAHELALKELLYGELYFASTDECNDPFDSKAFSQFPPDAAAWNRLLALAWHRTFSSKNLPSNFGAIADALSSACPMPLDAVAAAPILKHVFSLHEQSFPLLERTTLLWTLLSLLELYRPRSCYFASLSKKNDHSLMWSHYADHHRGFCLVFRALDGQLRQCGNRRRRGIEIAPKAVWAYPDAFSFQEVLYADDVEVINAFEYFPESVVGRKLSEPEQLELATRHQRQYLTKHASWSYEEEVRLILNPPWAWLSGSTHELSKQDRLLHFEPTQLVGIVLGAKMPDETKIRIREIVAQRQAWLAMSVRYKRTIFPFAMFSARLSTNLRGLDIIAEQIIDLSSAVSRDESGFDTAYSRWQDGWGLELHDGTGGNVRMP